MSKAASTFDDDYEDENEVNEERGSVTDQQHAVKAFFFVVSYHMYSSKGQARPVENRRLLAPSTISRFFTNIDTNYYPV
jgi:hypothetical protein